MSATAQAKSSTEGNVLKKKKSSTEKEKRPPSLKKQVTLKQIEVEKKNMVNRLAASVGDNIPRHWLFNIFAYVRQLPRTGTDFVDKTAFTAQLFKTFGLTDALLIERIHQVVATKVYGMEGQRVVSMEDMCRLVCIYVGDDLSLKTDFQFRVYNSTGRSDIESVLTTRDVFYKLRPTVHYMGATHSEDNEEDNARDIVEIMMSMMDYNSDGNIEYSEYVQTVKKSPLMLECMGPAFPPRDNLDEFKKLMELTELEVIAHFRAERRRSLGYPPSLQIAENPVQRWFPVRLDLP